MEYGLGLFNKERTDKNAIRRKFAFFPTLMKNDEYIWLRRYYEFYTITYELFDNSYNEFTIGKFKTTEDLVAYKLKYGY